MSQREGDVLLPLKWQLPAAEIVARLPLSTRHSMDIIATLFGLQPPQNSRVTKHANRYA